jgi:hypothetical protein
MIVSEWLLLLPISGDKRKECAGTERKLVYRQKNKSYMKDRTKAEVNMKKLEKCKPSKSEPRKDRFY